MSHRAAGFPLTVKVIVSAADASPSYRQAVILLTLDRFHSSFLAPLLCAEEHSRQRRGTRREIEGGGRKGNFGRKERKKAEMIYKTTY